MPGTISRPQRLATDRDGEHLMLAEEFEAETAPRRVDDSGTACWEVHTLTIRGRKIVGRRTTGAWTHRRFYYPAQFHDGVPDWVRTLAEQVLPAQPPPAVTPRPPSPAAPSPFPTSHSSARDSPAARTTPCASCPYRTDVPSGVWSQEDYSKLPRYDEPTWTQPPGLFLCHQHDRDDDRARVCGGWAGCHDGDHLLALRVAAGRGDIDLETAEAIRDYISSIPLCASGTDAAAHGMREITRPGPDARRSLAKIRRTRTRLT